MPSTIRLYTSHGSYRAAYDHLNSHTFVGKAKVLAPVVLEDDYYKTYIKRTLRLDPQTAKQPTPTLRSALSSHFARECRCEHDCCGHFNGGLYRMRKHGRNVTVWLSYHANV